MSNLERLGTHVADSLESATDADAAARLQRVRERLARGEGRSDAAPRPRIRRGAIIGALALAATVLVFVAFGVRATRPEQRALTFVVTTPGAKGATAESGVVGAFLAAPAAAELPISFSDGTSLNVAAGARARIAEVTPRGARVLVESGVVHANVVHAKDTRWLVDAGPFEVKVTGTRFDVGWQPADQAIIVTLHEGSVVVSGCGLADGQRVSAGQQLHASCKTGASTLSSIQTPSEPMVVATAASALPDAPAEPVAAPVLPHAAESTAVAGSALAPASPASPAAPAPSASAPVSAADLLARANVDRYAGRFDAATESLDTVRRRFRGSDAAATAAFELGRISFDGRHDFGAAGDWFDTYLRERPAGGFAREALGRAIESRHRAGDTARAAQLAARYLVAYPEGPHASLARRLSGEASP